MRGINRAKSGNTIDERIEFYSMPVPECGCIIWLGALSGSGYGKIKIGGESRLATRVVWEMRRGPIPACQQVCHSCDTPGCVNLDHLFLGTSKDNVADCISKGRRANLRGERHANSKLTDADVIAIRSSGEMQKVLAERYDVHQTVISSVQTRRAWRHV